jgi:hypothetical protein
MARDEKEIPATCHPPRFYHSHGTQGSVIRQFGFVVQTLVSSDGEPPVLSLRIPNIQTIS